MGRTRGKRGSNASKPAEPPSKRKRRDVTEAASSVSHSNNSQPRTMPGRNKSRGGRVATCSRARQMAERHQADTNDEAVVTHVLDQMQVTQDSDQRQIQNSTEPLIRRGDIASLAQEVARYLGAVNSTMGTRRQELSDSTKRPTVTTTIAERPNITTTTTTTIVPPQDTATLTSPVQNPPITAAPAFQGIQPPTLGT